MSKNVVLPNRVPRLRSWENIQWIIPLSLTFISDMISKSSSGFLLLCYALHSVKRVGHSLPGNHCSTTALYLPVAGLATGATWRGMGISRGWLGLFLAAPRAANPRFSAVPCVFFFPPLSLILSLYFLLPILVTAVRIRGKCIQVSELPVLLPESALSLPVRQERYLCHCPSADAVLTLNGPTRSPSGFWGSIDLALLMPLASLFL